MLLLLPCTGALELLLLEGRVDGLDVLLACVVVVVVVVATLPPLPAVGCTIGADAAVVPNDDPGVVVDTGAAVVVVVVGPCVVVVGANQHSSGPTDPWLENAPRGHCVQLSFPSRAL